MSKGDNLAAAIMGGALVFGIVIACAAVWATRNKNKL